MNQINFQAKLTKAMLLGTVIVMTAKNDFC